MDRARAIGFSAQVPTTTVQEDDRQPSLVWFGALLGPLLVWGGLAWAISAMAPDVNADGQCSGIGWGCSLTPADSITFVAMLGGLVVVPLVTIVTAWMTSRRRPEARPRTVLACLAVFAGATALLFGGTAVSG